MLSITQKDETETWCKKDKIRLRCQFQTPVQKAFPLMSAGASNKGPTSLRSSPTPERAMQKPTSTIPMYRTEIIVFRILLPLTPKRGVKKMYYLKVVMLTYHSIPKTCIYVNVTNCGYPVINVSMSKKIDFCAFTAHYICRWSFFRIDRPGSKTCTPLHPKRQTELLNIDLKGCCNLF